MRFIGTSKMGTHALSQLLSRKQPVGFHHGLLVGKKQGRMRTPLPSAFTRELCSRIQVRTSLLTCQEALSQMSNQAVFPWACTWSHPHCKNCVVMSLTGR